MYHMNYWNYKDFVKNLYENAKSKMAIIEVNGVY